MTKRAGAVPAETKETILKAAADEFEKNGFQGTSLRKICSAAGVTTGAIYFFFQGKDDLFETVISQVTVPFRKYMKGHYDSEHMFMERKYEENEQADIDISVVLIDFYFSKKQIWDIVLKHMSHPAVRDFIDGFVEESTDHYMYLIEMAVKDREVDRFAVHQFVHMQVDTMLTLISHDFTREEMTAHSEAVTRMLRAAFTTLTK